MTVHKPDTPGQISANLIEYERDRVSFFRARDGLLQRQTLATAIRLTLSRFRTPGGEMKFRRVIGYAEIPAIINAMAKERSKGEMLRDSVNLFAREFEQSNIQATGRRCGRDRRTR